MANKKISELGELTSVVDADVVLINDADATTATKSKWATVANLMVAAPVQSVAGKSGVVTLDYETDLINTPTTITGAQASAITANTAKVSFPGLGTSSSTALAGDTTTISVGQASAISANTAKDTFPGFGTTSSTALAGDTALLQIGTTSSTALAGDTALLQIGTTSSTALAGDTALLQIGTGAGDALAGDTALGTAAALDTGVAAGNVIVADATGLPAIDGSQLTGISGGGGGSVTAIGPFGYAYMAVDVAGTGTGFSWGAYNSSSQTTTVTFHAAQLDVNYNVIGHYDNYNPGGYGIYVSNKTVNGFDIALYDSNGSTVSPSSNPGVIMVYASDPTLRTVVAYTPPPVVVLEWSNMTTPSFGVSTDIYFDDYAQNVSNNPNSFMNATWGTANYMRFDLSVLTGKWKQYTKSDYYDSNSLSWTGQLFTDLHSALGTGSIGFSNNSGTLGVLANSRIENSTDTPIYVWAGTGGTTVTAVTADDGSGNNVTQDFVPIIYGTDWDGNASLNGPKWGMTIVMGDGSGNLEETGDAYNNTYVSNGSSPYSSHTFSTTASNTFTGFSLTGNGGQSNANSSTQSIITVDGGDQAG